MIFSNTFLSFFRTITSVISAILLLIVGMDEADMAKPDGAEITNKITYTLLDAKVVSQGITNDGEYYYFSGNETLGKADIKSGEIVRMNLDAIPDDLEEMGCNHIGGLSYYNGYVYAAVEDGPEYLNPYIVLYDAETLEFSGTYYRLPENLHVEGVPWCAVDVENNCIYTAEWNHATIVNIFSLDDMSYLGCITLTAEVDRIQGAELYDGKLYMSCDEENDLKRILSVDIETGVVEVAFTRNIGSVFEAEDMTITVDEDGPVFHVIDRGERRKSINLTSYKLCD